MRTFRSALVGVFLLGGLVWVLQASPLRWVPRAARHTITAVVGEGRVEKVEKEAYFGLTVYEVDFERHGAELKLRVTPDGQVVSYDTD